MMKRRLTTLTAAAALAVALGFSGAAQAQLTKFTDETAFVDASGAVMIGIPDSETAFNPAESCGGSEPTWGDLTAGAQVDIAFDSNMLSVTQSIQGPPPNSARGLCIFNPGFTPSLANTNPNDSTVPLLVANGEDDYQIVFDIPVAAIGFLLLTNSSSAETVTLKDSGGAVIDSAQDISGDTPDNGRQFIGFISTVPIKTVIFDTTGGATQNEGFEGFKAATFPPLSKELTSGPDVDSDGEIDVVIEVGQGTTTPYDFTITYIPGEEEGALVVDTVPAEWDVIEIDEDGSNLPLLCGGSTSFDVNALSGDDVDVFRGGKLGKSCRSANEIEWKPDPGDEVSTLLVDVTTRINPGHGKRQIEFYSPTSCGPLFLNDGATAFELDAQMNLVLDPPVTGDPVILPDGTTDALCLAAVENPGTNPGDRGPNADTDGDGLTDLAEACQLSTNPCVFNDEDEDGVGDGFDLCPDTNLADTPIDADGCGASQTP